MTRTAHNAAYERLANIRTDLARLTAAAENGFGIDYGHGRLGWADVITLARYAQQLRELSDQVFHEGEYAPEQGPLIRYALIDTNSGYVWSVLNAINPTEACRITDEGLGEHGRAYTETSRSAAADTTDGAYEVHAAPDGFDVEDGQNHAEIDAVDAMPIVAYVTWTNA